MTAKVCPRCQSENQVAARRCTHCDYAFVSQYNQPKRGAVQRFGLWGGAILTALAAWFIFNSYSSNNFDEPPSATPVALTDRQLLQQALDATVQIIVPDDEGGTSRGSGTVVSAEGHILTNFHILGDSDSGLLYNAAGEIYIALSPPGENKPPQSRYQAKIIESDLSLDLTLIQIVATSSGGALPADLGLTIVPLGDSDSVQIGDELTIIGYPSLGGATVTLTRGTVSGFLDVEGWLKTDAEINPGNSGGAAINEAGELVGVPTGGKFAEQFPGKLGLVRPVNLAQDVLVNIR